MFRVISTATLGLALSTGSAFADAHIQYQATEGAGASLQSLWIGHGMVRSDADRHTSVLLDPRSQTMIMLDHRKREFTRLGPTEMEQIGGAMADAMAQLEQAMADMPPEVRAQMQGMMGGSVPGMGSGPMVKMTDTGERDQVQGFTCTIYRTEVQNRVVNESCMGDTAVLDALGAEDRATLDDAMGITRQISERFSSGPMTQFADLTPFKAGLFPLRLTDVDGRRRATSEFVAIDSGALAASVFEIPSGYREQRIEMPGGRR